MKILTGFTLTILAVVSPLATQAQEHPGCFIIHSNGTFADLSEICPPLSDPAISVVASNNSEESAINDASQDERTYCEGLPYHLQDECFVNIDRSGNRFGTTFRPQSTSRRSILRSNRDSGTCSNPWDRDSAGRLCGGRAASERLGGQ